MSHVDREYCTIIIMKTKESLPCCHVELQYIPVTESLHCMNAGTAGQEA